MWADCLKLDPKTPPPIRHNAVLAHCETGLTYDEALKVCGVSEQLGRKWLRDRHFRRGLDVARRIARDARETKAVRAALAEKRRRGGRVEDYPALVKWL